MMMKVLSSFPASLHPILFLFRSSSVTIRCSSKERDYSSQVPLRYVPKKARQLGTDKEFFTVEDLVKRDAFRCCDTGLENIQKSKVTNSLSDGKTKMGSLFDGHDSDEDSNNEVLEMSEEEAVGDFEILEKNEFELTLRGSSGSKEDAEKMAIKLLAARAYTALELKKKLIGKRFTATIVDDVLSDFRMRGLINDGLYAEAYSRSRWMSSTWGPRRIKQALFTKGVNASDTEKAVKLVFQGVCDNEENSKHGLSQASMDHLYAQASKQWLRSQSANIDVRKSRIVRWLQYASKVLLIALGMIQAMAMQAPKKLNSKSVTVAIATPMDTKRRAMTCGPGETNIKVIRCMRRLF